MTTANETVKAIRKALRAAFPGIKFSLTTGSTGYLDLAWHDGPTVGQVDPIVRPFYSRMGDQPDDSARGVLPSRRYTPEAWEWATAQTGSGDIGTRYLALRLLDTVDLTDGVPAPVVDEFLASLTED